MLVLTWPGAVRRLPDLQIWLSAKPLACSLTLCDSHLESFPCTQELLSAWRRVMLPLFLQHCSLLWFLGQAGNHYHVWVKSLLCLLYCFTRSALFFLFISAFVLQLPRRPYVQRARWCEERPGAQVRVACVSSQRQISEKTKAAWYVNWFCGYAEDKDLLERVFSFPTAAEQALFGPHPLQYLWSRYYTWCSVLWLNIVKQFPLLDGALAYWSVNV